MNDLDRGAYEYMQHVQFESPGVTCESRIAAMASPPSSLRNQVTNVIFSDVENSCIARSFSYEIFKALGTNIRNSTNDIRYDIYIALHGIWDGMMGCVLASILLQLYGITRIYRSVRHMTYSCSSFIIRNIKNFHTNAWSFFEKNKSCTARSEIYFNLLSICTACI